MKSALALDKDSFEVFEAFEDDEEERIHNDAEFDWETGDFDTELTEFEGDEEVRGRGGRRGAPGSRGRSLRFSRPRRRRRGATRRIFPRLAVRRRWTVGYPPEETLQGADYVRWVQDSLNRVLALRLPVNGILGPETRSAVRRFQERERLPVTGIVGPDTDRALIAASARVEPAGPAEPEPSEGAALARVEPAGPAEPEPSEGELADLELEAGGDRSHPDYVRWIQQSLNRIMGLRLVADGRIRPETRSAIRSFHQRRGLRADAVVGAQTERALLAAGAGRPPLRLPVTPLRTPGPPAPTVPFSRRCRFRFTPAAVEARGGGRVRDKAPPRRTEVVEVKGVGGRRIPLHRLAAAAWQALVEAARSDGVARPLLLPTSGFRDPERQRRLWKDALQRYKSAEEARKWVAPPGTSAHQSGRAIDFYLGGENSSGNVANLRRLPAYRWLVENAVCFGFYPYAREPWHWEYNPPSTPSREFEMAEASMAEGAGTYPARISSC